MNLIRPVGLTLFVMLVAGAQSSSVSAVIAHIEGKVYLDEKLVETPVVLNGDYVVRTEDGRALIRLRSGTLFLGENSSVRVIDNQPYNFNRLEMTSGSAVVTTDNGSGLMVCEDTVTLSDGGVFHFDLQPIPGSQYSCRIRVYQGAASVQLATVATVLRTGKTMSLNRRAGDLVPWSDFDVADVDGLDRWSRQLRN
jgi:hypothetical protein